MDEGTGMLRQRGLPHQVRKEAGSFDPAANIIKVLTMHVRKKREGHQVVLRGRHTSNAAADHRDGWGLLRKRFGA